MKNIFDNLIMEFKKINEMGYVKGINNNITNSCGLTFEKLIRKKADSMFFPDFNGIEIKCKQRYSRYPISLFSISFDGPSLYESHYLLNCYGKQDNEFKNKKTLIINLNCNEKVLFNSKYYFELKIDYENKRLVLNIYDLNMKLIEKRAFVDFDSLSNRINIKLRYLALVKASKKIINGNLYFRYYSINCFILKNFDTFLELIKQKKINITLMLRFARSGKDIEKNKSKNYIFEIDKDDLNLLFDEVYCYEN